MHVIGRRSDLRLLFPKFSSLRTNGTGPKPFVGLWLGCCSHSSHLQSAPSLSSRTGAPRVGSSETMAWGCSTSSCV